MFNQFAYAAVDAVQTSKKQFVDTFVKHEGFKSALHGFVDAQTKYTKSAIDAGMLTATQIGTIVSSKQFYESLTDSFKSFAPTQKAK